MKKILSVLLVLVLAVGTTFAGVTLSGSASTEFAYNIDENTLGFAPTTELTVEFDAVTAEKVNEGGVYAGIKATLALNGFTSANNDDTDETKWISLNSADTKINEAYIAGDNWKVSILSAAGVPTFAAGWELDSDDNAADLAVSSQGTAPGVTVTVYDWVVGFGMSVDFNEGGAKEMSGSLKTPEFVLADGMTLQVGGGVEKLAGKGKVDLGAGLVFKYATDQLSVSASTDVLVYIPTTESVEAGVDADAAVSVSYAPVTADIYYATDVAMPEGGVVTYKDRAFAETSAKNYLSTKVAVDLATFDVPVVLTVAGLDLVNTQYLDFEVKSNIDALTVTGFGGYQVEYEKWHAGAEVAYDFGQVGVLSAGTTFVGTSNALTDATVKVGLENTTLVNGATLKVGYESGNLKAEKWGKIFASANIEF